MNVGGAIVGDAAATAGRWRAQAAASGAFTDPFCSTFTQLEFIALNA